jgi:hypothetical protein
VASPERTPATSPEERASYDRARRRVRELRAFHVHATVFVVVNAILHIVNLVTSRGEYWALWPLFGWGIGLLAHAAGTFRWLPFSGRDWEERKIKELMERDRGRG